MLWWFRLSAVRKQECLHITDCKLSPWALNKSADKCAAMDVNAYFVACKRLKKANNLLSLIDPPLCYSCCSSSCCCSVILAVFLIVVLLFLIAVLLLVSMLFLLFFFLLFCYFCSSFCLVYIESYLLFQVLLFF